jgi:multimeric flavodoxin WrbA
VKLTAFLGSPRVGGNTDTLTARVLDGAKESGLVTEAVELRKLKIGPCTGCDKCWEKQGQPCTRKDDMAALYEKIAESDILLFATPVYWYAPTSIMKAFIDRLVVFNRPRGRPMIEGKGAALVIAYEEEGPKAVEPMLRMFELSFEYLGLKLIASVVVDGVGRKGAVLQKPDALDQAYELGRSLAGWHSEGRKGNDRCRS